jgi:hypothetical protein
MTKHIIAVLALLASFAANATICNPTCNQPTNNLKSDEKAVDLKLTDASKDTVVTQLRIQAANNTKSVYSDKPVPLGLYELDINGDTVKAFCVDPFQPASSTSSKYIASKLDATDFISNGTVKFELAQRLYDNAYSSIEAASDEVKAGFHVALWEIFYDEKLDTTEGNISQSIVTTTTKTPDVTTCSKKIWGFCVKYKTVKGTTTTTTENKTDAEVLTAANSFLTALTNSDWKITNKYDLTFYKSVCNQDFIVAKLNPPSQVPVPTALPLFISALVGLGLMRRRKSA